MSRVHPQEFRADVVAVARRGDAPIAQIAKDFGISDSCLRNWLRAADVEDGHSPVTGGVLASSPRHRAPRQRDLNSSPVGVGSRQHSGPAWTPRGYAQAVLDAIHDDVLERVTRLQNAGMPLPDPEQLAGLLVTNLLDAPRELDPHYADLGPFYDSKGAAHQLGDITRQALSDRRKTRSVLAMRAGDGTWFYPAWQFTGAGTVNPTLAPVLRASAPLDRWAAGVWLVSEHPDLGGRSPRTALRDGDDLRRVAALALVEPAKT